jgi:Domain of unknown function (DUF4160)
MSPTVLREKGYRFFFFSKEEARCHVHVEARAVVRLSSGWNPNLSWLGTGLSRKQLKEAEAIVEENYDRIVRAWHEHFGS